MANYVDETGLSRLAANLKSYVDSRAEEARPDRPPTAAKEKTVASLATAEDADLEAYFEHADDVPSGWKVGDERKVTLTGEQAGEYTMVIMGEDSTPLYDDAPFSATGTVQQRFTWSMDYTLPESFKMSETSGYAGRWKDSDLRKTLNEEVYQRLP